MFSCLLRTVKCRKSLQTLAKNNGRHLMRHSKWFNKKIRGYPNNSINKFYHHSNILENSFRVTPTTIVESELDSLKFEKISDDTLDSLAEYFDELVECAEHLPDADVSYGNGVLTIKFGEQEGTYVINRQTPNKQIWLSSPKSGPKRYDFINGTWIYKHDGKSLHELLDNEISLVVKNNTSFIDKCAHSKKENK